MDDWLAEVGVVEMLDSTELGGVDAFVALSVAVLYTAVVGE